MENSKRTYRTVIPEIIRRNIRKFRNNSEAQENRERTLRLAFDFYKSRGLMFIHIPKAAGVSVFHALYGRDSWGHFPLSEFVGAFGRDEVYRIPRACIVRNPYLRLHSGYEYLRRGGRGKGLDFEFQEMLRPYETFEKFVKESLASGGALNILHFKPQSHWVTDSSGNLGVDYVGRFEHMEESFNEMTRLFGVKAAPLPRLNKSPGLSGENPDERRISELFDSEMIAIVDRVYKEDFQIFDYSTVGS